MGTTSPIAAGETFATSLLTALRRETQPDHLDRELALTVARFQDLANLLEFIQQEEGHDSELQAARECLQAAADGLVEHSAG